MALIEATIAAKAGPARASISGEPLRPHLLVDREHAAIVLVGTLGTVPDLHVEPLSPWATTTALNGPLVWPPHQYARVRDGWLIRLEHGPGQYGVDLFADGE